MYLTIYSNTKPHQITFEELLKNPFIKPSDFSKKTLKKVTIPVSDEYAKTLFEKYNLTNNLEMISNIIMKEDYDTNNHYTHFKIPKKSNPHKYRKIDAPDDELGNMQTIIKSYIEDYLKVLPHKAAHAYVEKCSTITAMEKHRDNNSKWYLQLDLKDFFNSINAEWLNKMLLEVYPFKYIDNTTLNTIIKAALLNNELPQGSRLSPTLTNIVMTPIDYDITEALHNYNRHHFIYTRYADDITISCKEKFEPSEIITLILDIFNKWQVPFKINRDKTRFGNTSGRNYHLGLIINKDNKISVGHEKNNKFRAQLYNFCTVGEYWDKHDIQKMLGLISYYKAIEPEFVKKTIEKYNRKFNIDIINKAQNLIKE